MDRRSRTVVAVMAVPTFTIGTDFTGALMLILPIEKEFGVDVTTTQWVLNIYALTFAMGMVAAGRLADLYGRRRLFNVGAVIFVIGSLGCAAAPSIGGLIAARAVQGVGASILWPCILGITATSVREDERGIAMGLIIGTVAAGNVIGPVIAGVVGGLGEWRLFYLVNLVLGVVSALLVLRVIAAEAGSRRDEKIDYTGMIVVAVAVLCLLYALDVGSDWGWGWGSMGIIGLVTLAIVLLVAFPFIEDRAADPMVPSPMMRNRQFLLALSTNGLCIPAIFLLFLYLPQYLHKVTGWSVLEASVGTIPLMLTVAVMSVIAGRLYNRVGPRRLLTAGYVVTALGALATTQVSAAWGYAGLLPTMILVGLGCALVVGTAGAAAVGAADPSRASLAGALSFMFHLAFGATGVAAGTAILFAASKTALAGALSAAGITMSPADQLTLSAAAASSPASLEILNHFPTDTAARITSAMNDAFVSGLHQAYWLALAFAVIGIAVAVCIRDEKLVNVDS